MIGFLIVCLVILFIVFVIAFGRPPVQDTRQSSKQKTPEDSQTLNSSVNIRTMPPRAMPSKKENSGKR